MIGLNLSTSLCSKQITLALGKSVSLMQFSSTVMKHASNADTAIQILSTDSSVIKYPYCRTLKLNADYSPSKVPLISFDMCYYESNLRTGRFWK